jgi:hypothetical protein
MSMNFTAANLDYINVGQPSVLNLLPQGTEYTLSAWVKTATNVDYGTIICRGNATTKQYHLSIGSPGPPYEIQAQIGGTFYTTGVDVGDGLWHHVALRNYNDSGTYRFQMYSDGTAAGSATASGASTVVTDTLIGARRATLNTGSGFLLTGSLSDIRVYNRLLAVTEISTIYATRGKDFIMNGLVGRWLLNEREPGIVASGSGIVKDSSSEGNHGTPSGTSPTYDSDRLTFVRHENVSIRG